MGLAHYKYSTTETSQDKSAGQRWYALQLLLNGTWSLIFFRQRAPRTALVNLVLLIGAIAGTMAQFGRVSKTSSRLLLPYFLWCCFAAYLNFEICRRNDTRR
jgi:tryptophan-rich sensory protein